ncbi:MAG: class A beta-lactamase-related serine hydrolase [bacterium]|nr:class A beta-lactamase-related serine hydrolase [bacterium]
MGELARNYRYDYDEFYGTQRQLPYVVKPRTSPIAPQRPKRYVKRKKTNIFAKAISFGILACVGYGVMPLVLNDIVAPLFIGKPNKAVAVDCQDLLFPTAKYLNNDNVLNVNVLRAARTKKPLMANLYTTERMTGLENNLKALMNNYKTIQPSIYVWDYDSGKYADINASKVYSAASIIKLPVLIQLFKSIEENQLTVYDEMTLTPYYKAEGSGTIKNSMSGTNYTIDELAKKMIQVSDNSATNMIMAKIGGMPDVNGALRSWGIQHTTVNNWLPDLAGTNYTTARDLAKMLYNIDNPGFLNINSREYIIDYMSHVENNRLIQAGLPKDAMFVHKTGDIGKMLGDAGIVYTPEGKKYIVVILANRPYNSPMGKNFIQQASSMIYEAIVKGYTL